MLDDAFRLLLIRRGQEPSRGRWSVPGGRCLPGETPEHACVREVQEETGLVVTAHEAVGRIEREGPGGVVYDIVDFRCELQGGDLRAGDDAIDARWVTRAELAELDLAPGLLDCLAEWGLLPA